MKIHLIVLSNKFNQKLFQEFNPVKDEKTYFVCLLKYLKFPKFPQIGKEKRGMFLIYPFKENN